MENTPPSRTLCQHLKKAKWIPQVMATPSQFRAFLPSRLRPSFDSMLARRKYGNKKRSMGQYLGARHVRSRNLVGGILDSFLVEIDNDNGPKLELPDDSLQSAVYSRRVQLQGDQGPMDILRLDELNRIYSVESKMLAKVNKQAVATLLDCDFRERPPDMQRYVSKMKSDLKEKIDRLTSSIGLTGPSHDVTPTLVTSQHRLQVLDACFEISPYPNVAEIAFIGITLQYGDAWGLEHWFADKRESRGYPDNKEGFALRNRNRM
ncbi:hypothetical protein MBLNU230_g6765t1 [Neophaeotheca triangularis]